MSSRCRSIPKGILFFFLPLLFCLVMVAPVWAATWYVSPLGDDADTGTEPANALATISAAVNVAQNGDTIKVAQGVYAEAVLVSAFDALSLEGGWDAAFSVRDRDTYETLIQGNGVNHGFEFQNCTNCSVSGFHVTGANYGVYIRSTESANVSVTVSDNSITACVNTAIFFGTAYVVVKGNEVVDNLNHGIAGWSDYEVTRGDIIGNYVINNNGTGIYVISNKVWYIHNNIVVGNQGVGIFAAYPGMRAQVTNNTIMYNTYAGCNAGYYGSMAMRNNIIAFNGDYGIKKSQTNTYFYSEFNDVYGNTPGDYLDVIPQPTDFSLDPLVDETYHLTELSPCIDAGKDMSAVFTDDIDGDPRAASAGGDGLYDVGADEAVIDNDQDGWIASMDCDDNDPAVHPKAAEVKHDGIDQDCNGYDLTIDITKANYASKRDILRVEAMSSLGGTAQLVLSEGHVMTYKANQDRWDITLDPAGGNPGTVWVCGIEGCESAPVKVE